MRNDRTRIIRRCGPTAFSVAMVMVAPTVGYTQTHLSTLMNLSPWKSCVHFFCRYAGESACTAVMDCGQKDGNPVTWDVAVISKTIFAYYPGKTVADGSAVDLEAALIGAGLTVEDVRRRTTCAVRSNDLLDVRAYRWISGEIIPVNNPAVVLAPTSSDGNPDDHANTLAGATPLPLNDQTEGHWEHPYDA